MKFNYAKKHKLGETLMIRILVLTFFFLPFLQISYSETLDEIRRETLESTQKNEVIMPNLPKGDNLSIIKKRCLEQNLNEEECKIKIKEYQIKNYKENRYIEPGLGSQEHN
jgi:hypothetical protein